MNTPPNQRGLEVVDWVVALALIRVLFLGLDSYLIFPIREVGFKAG